MFCRLGGAAAGRETGTGPDGVGRGRTGSVGAGRGWSGSRNVRKSEAVGYAGVSGVPNL
jgi:hypothetical protein